MINNPTIFIEAFSWFGFNNISKFWRASRIKQKICKQYALNPNNFSDTLSNQEALNLICTTQNIHPNRASFSSKKYYFIGASILSKSSATFDFSSLERDVPLIYISLGTSNINNNTEFYKSCLAAFKNRPFNIIISLGTNLQIEQLGEIPANCIVKNYVPQLEILEHADLFITHAGINSMHEGLYFGVPMLSVPLQGEQIVNAYQIKRLGCGEVMNAKHQNSSKILHQTEKILSQKSYRKNCQLVGKTLRNEHNSQFAVNSILSYIKHHSTNPIIPQLTQKQLEPSLT